MTAPTGAIDETVDVSGAFPRLSAEQIDLLEPYGRHQRTHAGQVLFREGDATSDFFVVLEGQVAVVEGYECEEHVLSVHGPGRFLGELGLLTGQAVFVTAVVRQPGEVLAVAADDLRELLVREPTLADVILSACLARRTLLIELGTGLRIIGSRFSPETAVLRDFAARNRLPHRFIDLERDAGVEALLDRLGVRPDETPVVVWRGTQVLRNPSPAQLADLVGLRPHLPSGGVCDLVIVGAGPAGLGAAVYGASEGLSTIVVERTAPGGQAGLSPRIENYLGFPAGISGADLADRAVVQAQKFGAWLGVPAEVAGLEADDGYLRLRLTDGSAITGRTVVIASGARYRRLRVPGLDRLEPVAVYYAATLVEARQCGGLPVVVVGGGNSAGQAVLFLANHASATWLVLRGGDLGHSMSRYLADRIERHPDIEVLRHTEVSELIGERSLEAVVVEDSRSGHRHRLEARALFVFIGAEPHTRWLEGMVALDDRGFVLTGGDATDPATGLVPARLETNRTGVFAAGDVRSGSVKRVAAAVGEGAMAIRFVHDHVDGLVHPDEPAST